MENSVSSLHIAMYPWFALGHMHPYIELSNKLAQKGHTISFIIPPKTKSKLEHLNRYPHLITFYPITLPHVDGLPSGVETTNDVPFSSVPLLMIAMDKTESEAELLLQQLKPHLIIFDFSFWMPKLARRLGIKSMYYSVVIPAQIAYNLSPASYHIRKGKQITEADLMKPPPGYPDSSVHLHFHEARDSLSIRNVKTDDNNINVGDRLFRGLNDCEVIGFRSRVEIDGPYADYLEKEFGKTVLLSGLLIPDTPSDPLEHKWVDFLGRFTPGSVIYCAFGSEVILTKDQFQDLLLGLELAGLPFLAALRTPSEFDSIVEALPKGFQERTGGRGMVHGGWIQQPQILKHPSIGCFITHCGAASLIEALMNKCQLVLLPKRFDHFMSARFMGQGLKVGVEVEKSEEGLFTKESVCKAIKTVMEEDNEVGEKIRANLAKLRQQIHGQDLESSYIDNFSHKLKTLLA